MEYTFPVMRTTHPKPRPADETKLGFAKYFTDHMFVMDYDEHVVGEVFRKAQLRLVGRTGLGVRSPYHREVVFHFSFLLMFMVHIKAICRGGRLCPPNMHPILFFLFFEKEKNRRAR